MAPIHETDIAEERWARAEWENYELWEKVEVRLRRRKWLWIAGAGAVFVLLSSIPIVLDRLPKWSSMAASRRLADAVSEVKRRSAVDHHAFRIRFPETGEPAYVIEEANRCSETKWKAAGSGEVVSEKAASGFHVLSTAEAQALGIPGVIRTLCYDPLDGIFETKTGVAGFGVIPAKDLTESRMDRVSVLLVDGPSGALSFD